MPFEFIYRGLRFLTDNNTISSSYRMQGLLVVPVVFSALVLFWNLPALGLSHWDEYNYLETAAWFLRIPGNAFTIYEPPGFPFLVAVFFRFFGLHDYVAVAVSALFAVLTVALVAYFGLKLFGTRVAFAAPLMLTLCPLFITYARMALTDMTFTFFFTLSIVAWYRTTISRGTWNWALAGFAFAGAVMTKYNGFMAAVIFAAYLVVALRNVGAGERVHMALRGFVTLLLTCVPAAVLSLLFIAFLGASTEIPESHIFSTHTLKLIIINAPQILREGMSKFEAAAVLPHGGQLGLFPLAAAPFYLQVLAYFVPVPVLLLALIGLVGMNVRKGPELFVGVWVLGTFLLVSSVPAHYSRAILPILPPVSLAAAIGLLKVNGFVEHFVTGRHVKFSMQPLIAVLLIVVMALSVPGAVQGVSIQHDSYRIAGQYLASVAGGGPVLAQTQLVLAFYHPAEFAAINQTNLSSHQYLVVDFVATENGYTPIIQQLTREGRLKLIDTIPADLPPEVYLDWISFGQLAQWNYTYIQIYQITNVTATS